VRWLISDFFSVATSPGGDFYMATTTGSAVSRDGGLRWVPLKIAGPLLLANDSEGAQFSFVPGVSSIGPEAASAGSSQAGDYEPIHRRAEDVRQHA
jgi:hypothetical protein